MSPPCVAHFEGDNGGATYQGVTGDEISVLFLPCTNCVNEDDGTYGHQPGAYCDVDAPPDSDPGCHATTYPGTGSTGQDNWQIKVLRALSNYFNQRFQTYGRHVHLRAYWGEPSTTTSPEQRRAEAADHLATVDPFAVIDRLALNPGGYRDAYALAMAKGDVVNFLNFDPQPAAFFRQHASLLWHLYPDIEHWAEMYVDYVCTRVAGFPVAHAQGGADTAGRPYNGRGRTYGLIWLDDQARPHYRSFAKLVREGLAGLSGLSRERTG